MKEIATNQKLNYIFQEPFGTVTLNTIGDDAAPTFFEINQEGRIKVKAGANLTTDTETNYRVSLSYSCIMLKFSLGPSLGMFVFVEASKS